MFVYLYCVNTTNLFDTLTQACIAWGYSGTAHMQAGAGGALTGWDKRYTLVSWYKVHVHQQCSKL